MSFLTEVNAMLLIAGLPFLTAVLIWLAGRSANLRDGIHLLMGVVTFALTIWLYRSVDFVAPPMVELLQVGPGLSLGFKLEPLGMLFALIASGLWIVATLYSIGYMRGNNEHEQTRFFVCFALAIGSTLALAFSANLLTLLAFYEVLTVSTFPLVTHKGTPDAMRAGRVYLGTLIATSIGFLLLAIAGTYFVAGSLDFVPGGLLAGKASGPVVVILLFLYVFGIGKAAVMPVHRWLPAAMVAPTPVSALLHAVAVVKAGVFSVVKVVVYVFGIDTLSQTSGTEWIAYIAGITIVTASIIALRQDNLKRRLAYSTISQLSYVVLAAALFTPLSIIAAALHIAAHAFGKITLFFAAGSIYTAAHKSLISELDGIGHKMPWTMGAFCIAVLSMIGLPPTAGFISKWFLLQGSFEAENMIAVGVIILSTLLNTAYFMPILWRAFFKTPADGPANDHGEAPLPIVLALVTTAALTVAFFFWPTPFLMLSETLIGGAR